MAIHVVRYSRVAKTLRIVSANDTNAVDWGKATDMIYREPTLNEQIKELGFILRSLSKE